MEKGFLSIDLLVKCHFRVTMVVVALTVGLMTLACSDREDVIPIIDHCPSCTSSIKINGTFWPSKPSFAWYQVKHELDTFFDLEINELNPIHDSFSDAFLFANIPYDTGSYVLDSMLVMESGTAVYFFVFEVEYGTPAYLYNPILDGQSMIHVEYLDKSTGAFGVRFELALQTYIPHIGWIPTSVYPGRIVCDGVVEGMVTGG